MVAVVVVAVVFVVAVIAGGGVLRCGVSSAESLAPRPQATRSVFFSVSRQRWDQSRPDSKQQDQCVLSFSAIEMGNLVACVQFRS